MSFTRNASPARSLLNPASVITLCALGLTFLGLTILFSASAYFKNRHGVAVPYLYLQKQILGVVVAAVLCFVTSRLDLEDIRRRYAWWIGGACLLLLGAVLLMPKINGSRRWLEIGGMSLQVAEFTKIGMVFCLAHYLALNQTRIGEFKRGYCYPLAIIGAFVGLIVVEPDFGMAAFYLAVGLTMLFLAGAKWRHLFSTVALAAVAFGLLILQNPNRLRRLKEFWTAVPYQIEQSFAAFAAGGYSGVGLGQGRQQLSFLPYAHTDMIFAVVGEELGLGFTLGVVAIFGVILVAGLIHLRRAPNPFHFQLVTGCLLFISLQAAINLLSVTGLVPPKGMSLPFISAGMSNLLLMGVLLGVIWNTQRTWGRVGLADEDRTMREVLA